MLVANELPRKFQLTDKGKTITLDDPDPSMPTDAVMNFYATTYPILTTAKINGPEIKDDSLLYSISSVMGTKG